MKAFCLLVILSVPLMAHTQPKKSSFETGLSYTADFFGNVSGGLDTGVRYLDNIDVTINTDLESLAGLPNSNFFIYGIGNQGGSISELAGDVQGISNIEAENSWRLYEAWFEHVFPNFKTSILLGLYDVNSEFDVIQTGLLFINSSHGMGAGFGNSGVLGPSTFPYTSLGARVKANITEDILIKAAVVDGIPSDPGNTQGTKIFLRQHDGALITGELNYEPDSPKIDPTDPDAFLTRGVPKVNRFRFVLGGWIYTQPRAGWLGADQHDKGIYATAESRLYSETGAKTQGLAGFIRVGMSNGKINRFSGYTGAGLVYTGMIDKRDEDQLGLAVAIPWSSPDYQSFAQRNGQNAANNETNIEATYLYMLSSGIQLQLDAQYVINPNTLHTIDNAWVLGMRLVFSL